VSPVSARYGQPAGGGEVEECGACDPDVLHDHGRRHVGARRGNGRGYGHVDGAEILGIPAERKRGEARTMPAPR